MVKISTYTRALLLALKKKHLQNRIYPACCALALLLLLIHSSMAQPAGESIPDISKVQTVLLLGPAVTFDVYKKNSIGDDRISSLSVAKKIPAAFSQKVPFDMVADNIYLRFTLFNSSDSAAQVYFFPGRYCRKSELFKANAGAFSPVKNSSDSIPSGFELISLGAKEKAEFITRLDFVPTTANILSPSLVTKDFIPYFRNNLLNDKATVNLLNYITAGILLMMIFYSIAVYTQNYNIEFLYYSGYAGCMGILLFLKSYLFGATTSFNYFFEGYFDFIIQITGYFFYLLFFRKFLNTKADHPFLERILNISNWILLISVILFSVAYFAIGEFRITNFIENIIKQLLLVISILFIFYGTRKKDPLVNYLVMGQLFLTLFASVSFLLMTTTLKISGTPNSIFNDSLLYYQIGLILELVFFMSGLSYKNKRDLIERIKERERLKLENERKEFEKQVAILEAKQQERNRISADMHDELGSGVTAIRLMSEIVKAKMKENTLPEIEKISQSANELLNKMNTIIWTMVSSNDTVESLIAYIRAYAVEFFENTPIDCRFNIPANIPPQDLSGEKRRNLFLSVKEALNNVLKHSSASMVTINVIVQDKLLIEISDNGIGIDLEKTRKFGNGLHNMKRRIASIAGEFRIENQQGTIAVFELEL